MYAMFSVASSTRYGPMCPCPSWLRGVKVTRGPAFVRSGFADQDVGPVGVNVLGLYVGRTVAWSEDTINSVSQEMHDDVMAGGDGEGYWYPHRSAVVVWPHDADPCLHKAGEECGQVYDLGFWPLDLALRSDDDISRFYLQMANETMQDIDRFESALRLHALRIAVRIRPGVDGHEQARYDLVNQVKGFMHHQRVEATRTIQRGECYLRVLLKKAHIFQARAYPAIPETILDRVGGPQRRWNPHAQPVQAPQGQADADVIMLGAVEGEALIEGVDEVIEVSDGEEEDDDMIVGDEGYWADREFDELYID